MPKKQFPLENISEFAARLRAARKKAGFTQMEAAVGIGTTQASVTAWEREIAEPGLESLRRLARLYGVTVDYLLLGEGEEEMHDDQVIVHLPRGDPGPVDKEQTKLLERALVVLRAKGPAQHYAGSLTNNINSFYKGVRDTNRLMAGSPGKKAAGDS